MALIYEPKIFKAHAEVRAAMTLRGSRNLPYGFNMSLSVGDDERRVRDNRAQLARRLGFAPERLATQRQVHGCAVCDVASGYAPTESDALITRESAWLLAISIADCAPILLYDARQRIVAGVHSGWRGSLQNIVGATVKRLREQHGVDPQNLIAYVGAAAGQCCYEVGDDVASAFDKRYSRSLDTGKFLFDNKGVVLDQLLDAGVSAPHIELDARCTICDPNLHSYRREGQKSGRAFAVIGIASK